MMLVKNMRWKSDDDIRLWTFSSFISYKIDIETTYVYTNVQNPPKIIHTVFEQKLHPWLLCKAGSPV